MMIMGDFALLNSTLFMEVDGSMTILFHGYDSGKAGTVWKSEVF